MTDDDLEDMAAMLADPAVMKFHSRPKNREEARAWINWNKSNYVDHGHGLWIIETKAGEFAGDCGLTWQVVNGRPELEVGYHVRAELRGRGYSPRPQRPAATLPEMSWGQVTWSRSRTPTTEPPDEERKRSGWNSKRTTMAGGSRSDRCPIGVRLTSLKSADHSHEESYSEEPAAVAAGTSMRRPVATS